MAVRFNTDTLIIILTTPTGFGHIRVADALRRGIQPQSQVTILGASDSGAQWLHHLMSHRAGKWLFEFVQENRILEKPLTGLLKRWLRSHPGKLMNQIAQIVANQKIYPQKVILMLTHPMMAHQLVPIKSLLETELDVRLTLALVVTDDSPQEVWAVNGVDVIFVPSNSTREALMGYLLADGGAVPEMVTCPYPVSPTLGEQLSQSEIKERKIQLTGKNLHVCIPVSGAAVGLAYAQAIMEILLADKYRVSVVVKESGSTAVFREWCSRQSRVQLLSHQQNQEVVNLYEQLYDTELIGVEITKPSEQAFKTLCTPREKGGVVLLFSAPVGRQEKDNLAFLRRHRLIPSLDDQARLNEWGLHGNRLHITSELLDRASHWRGVVLPRDGHHAGIMIERLIEAKVLAAMGNFKGFLEGHKEIRSSGVRELWEYLRDRG